MKLIILIATVFTLLSACTNSTSDALVDRTNAKNMPSKVANKPIQGSANASKIKAKSHGGHSKSKGSLLPECQDSSALPSPHCGRVPTLAFGDDGILYLVFSQNGHIYFTTSTDKGLSYNAPVVVNSVPEKIYDDGENRPKIILGNQGEVYVSWTHKTQGRYSGDVRFSRSLDKGLHFDAPVTINSNRDLISHRFDAMTLDSDGRIIISWIDKRDQKQAKERQQTYDGAAIYYAVSEDRGTTFKANSKLADHSCECCRIAMDSDINGKVVALWRHVYPGNIRDHAISYIDSQGGPINGQPAKATEDDWKIEGCPHHGPDMSIDSKNTAHIVWFTQGKKQKGLMYGQFSLQEKKSGRVLSIDAAAGAARPQVDVEGQNVYLLWKRFNGMSMDLLMRRSDDGGLSWSDNQIIATTANGSDHPDWVRDGKRLFASWHTQSEGLKLIKAAQ